MTTPAPMDPYSAGAQAGLSATTDIIGLILNQQAQANAIADAKRLDARDYAEMKRQNAFSQKIQKEQLGLAQRATALNENKFVEDQFQNRNTLSEKAFNQMQTVLQNNTALRDRVIKLWS